MKFKILLILTFVILSITNFTYNFATETTDTTAQTSELEGNDSSYYINDESLTAESAILIDSDTGQILYEKNAHTLRYPASTTKVLTALIILENCDLSDVFYIDAKSPFAGGSGIALEEGEPHTVEEILYAMLMASANEAAEALAVYYSGSVEEFAKVMNTRASELGALNSNFVNPHGLHDPDHVSTAYDLSLIAQVAVQNEKLMEIVNTPSYTFPANEVKTESRVFHLTNQFIKDVPGSTDLMLYRDEYVPYYYEYMTGLKTGYTPEAQYCFIGSASKDGMNLVSVVLKSNGISGRYTDTRKLIDYGLYSFNDEVFYEKDEYVGDYTLNDINSTSIELFSKDQVKLWVRNDTDLSKIDTSISIDSDLALPIKSDDEIGYLSISTGDNQNIASPLIVSQDITGLPLLDSEISTFSDSSNDFSFSVAGMLNFFLKLVLILFIWRIIMTIIRLIKIKHLTK